MLAIGFGLLLVGFGFKISSAVHMLAPDAYEGAPREPLHRPAPRRRLRLPPARAAHRAARRPARWPMSCGQAASHDGGHVVALPAEHQAHARLLPSIAHVGYCWWGVWRAARGNGAVLFYLLVYRSPPRVLRAVLLLERNGREAVQIPTTAGSPRGTRCCGGAVGFLLSLIGIPPTAGFVAFHLFGAAVKSGSCGWRDRRAEKSAVAATTTAPVASCTCASPRARPPLMPRPSPARGPGGGPLGRDAAGRGARPLFDLAQAAVIPRSVDPLPPGERQGEGLVRPSSRIAAAPRSAARSTSGALDSGRRRRHRHPPRGGRRVAFPPTSRSDPTSRGKLRVGVPAAPDDVINPAGPARYLRDRTRSAGLRDRRPPMRGDARPRFEVRRTSACAGGDRLRRTFDTPSSTPRGGGEAGRASHRDNPDRPAGGGRGDPGLRGHDRGCGGG